MFNDVMDFVNYLTARHNATSYLELAGQTNIIRKINCGRKTLVSPCKELEWQGVQSSGYDFFNTSWATFFETEPEATVLWDILHLSGPAPFADSLNTFTMGIEKLHHHGVAIISHTVPSGPAALDAQTTSEAGIPWAGEAFKTVLAIHDVFNTLSYCTVMNVTEPFTVIWRSQPRITGPAFASLNAIGALDFFDLLRQAHLMMPIADDLLLDVLGMTLEPSLYRDPQAFVKITEKALSQMQDEEMTTLKQALTVADRQLTRLKGSWSWRLTTPLRKLNRFFIKMH